MRLSHASRFGADSRALLTVPACGEISIREGSSGISEKAVRLDVRSNDGREGVKCERMKAQSRDLILLEWNPRVGCRLSSVGSTLDWK